MTPEQLEQIKDTLKNVQPADGSWLPQTVQANIYKALNAINRELRKYKESQMGCNPLSRKCSSSPYAVDNSNPDPKNFIIVNEKEHRGYLILLVKYPNCTNYEGKKLLVYEGFKSSKELLEHNNNKLDPHFSDTVGSPMARFRPRQTSVKLIEAMINAITIPKKSSRKKPEAS